MAASAFRWGDVCPWVISMPHSADARASVLKQLKAQNIGSARVWPGLDLRAQPELLEPAVKGAADVCLVPPSYVADKNASAPRWHGTVGSTLAHLQLLRHVYVSGACGFALVLADDVVLLEGFRDWVSTQMLAATKAAGSADLLNLAAVRAWGAPTKDTSGRWAKRVSGALTWPQWSEQPSNSQQLWMLVPSSSLPCCCS